MSASGYNTSGRVACVKCKQRHKPPVGASYPRVKAVRTRKHPAAQSSSSKNINLGTVDAVTGTVNKDSDTASGFGKKHPSTSEVMEKLDSILTRFEDIEKWLDNQEKRNSNLSVLTYPSAHSSPKRKKPRLTRTPHNSHHSGDLPSMDYLREDSRVQAEVDRRLNIRTLAERTRQVCQINTGEVSLRRSEGQTYGSLAT